MTHRYLTLAGAAEAATGNAAKNGFRGKCTSHVVVMFIAPAMSIKHSEFHHV